MSYNKFFTGIILCASVLLFSCQTNESKKTDVTQAAEWSSDEKEIARKEISARIDEIIKGAKELNADAALEPYSNDPDFKIVSPDASVADFTTMKHVLTESFQTLASLNFATIQQDFTFLEKDLVMCTWTGMNEFQLKTGEKMKIDPYVGSMLFRRKDNIWKIIYAHETAAIPVTVK